MYLNSVKNISPWPKKQTNKQTKAKTAVIFEFFLFFTRKIRTIGINAVKEKAQAQGNQS